MIKESKIINNKSDIMDGKRKRGDQEYLKMQQVLMQK